MLLLTEDEVRSLLTMELALEAVEAGLRKVALDEAENVPRSRCRTDHAMLHVLSASAKSLGALGFKAYTTTKSGAIFHVGLYDGRTGALTALIQADHLGQMRTGAASGIATRLLAGPDAESVGVFGTGKQARTQLIAVCKVRRIASVRVYSRDEGKRSRFAEEMTAACGVTVEPVADPEAAARERDIVVTATSSREPVLQGDWLAPGTHLNVIGSNFLGKAEIDPRTCQRSDLVVVDSKDQAKIEAGDLVNAVEKGTLHWADVAELGQVLVERFRGRRDAAEITLFKSLGLGIEDVAVAARVVALAKERGVGREIEF